MNENTCLYAGGASRRGEPYLLVSSTCCGGVYLRRSAVSALRCGPRPRV